MRVSRLVMKHIEMKKAPNLRYFQAFFGAFQSAADRNRTIRFYACFHAVLLPICYLSQFHAAILQTLTIILLKSSA